MEPKQNKTLGETLLKVRTQNGKTQVGLAAALSHFVGFSQGRISRLERGLWTPDAGQCEQLITALECTEQQARELRQAASINAQRRADVA